MTFSFIVFMQFYAIIAIATSYYLFYVILVNLDNNEWVNIQNEKNGPKMAVLAIILASIFWVIFFPFAFLISKSD